MTLRHGSTVTIPPMVSVFTRGVGWVDESIAASAPASGSITEGFLYYYPIILPASCTVRRMWWANGATIANNIDAGIYADDGDAKPGTLLISTGATAVSGTNVVQFADVTDTIIGPGRYWLAIVMTSSGGTPTMFRSSITATAMDAAMLYYENNGLSPLPSSATPLESVINYIYLFGFSTTTSP